VAEEDEGHQRCKKPLTKLKLLHMSPTSQTVEMGTHYQMSALMSSRVNLTTDAITDWEPKGPGIFYTRAKLAF